MRTSQHSQDGAQHPASRHSQRNTAVCAAGARLIKLRHKNAGAWANTRHPAPEGLSFRPRPAAGHSGVLSRAAMSTSRPARRAQGVELVLGPRRLKRRAPGWAAVPASVRALVRVPPAASRPAGFVVTLAWSHSPRCGTVLSVLCGLPHRRGGLPLEQPSYLALRSPERAYLPAMDPGVPGHGAGGGEAGRSGWPGEAAVPAPEVATHPGLDSQRLQDSVSWLRSAALSSARVPEAQGGVLGGTRDAASTQVLLAARQALSLARHTPAPSGEPRTTARAPRRVGRAAATSGDEALLNDDATATRSGLPLHSYERCAVPLPHTRHTSPAPDAPFASVTLYLNDPGVTRALGAPTRPGCRSDLWGRPCRWAPRAGLLTPPSPA